MVVRCNFSGDEESRGVETMVCIRVSGLGSQDANASSGLFHFDFRILTTSFIFFFMRCIFRPHRRVRLRISLAL